MPRRVPIRLVRLLAVACACLLPVASAQAAPPVNDLPTTPTQVTLLWTAQSEFQSVVQATDWGEATTGPEDADPLPSCTGSTGFRSTWYSLSVPEAAVLRVTVVSTDPVRYQPVVNVLSPSREEVGCGLANDVRQGATANATAYVTPAADGKPQTYLIRVAEVANNSPSGGLPTLTVRFAAQDVTAPHIRVQQSDTTPSPRVPTTYDALGSNPTTDNASQVNPATALWEFHDKLADGRDTMKERQGLRVDYTWMSSGPHDVVFRVSDFAGNQAMYRFSTLVRDTLRPDVKFSLRPPEPGARRLRITVQASESVHVRLLVTQVGRAKPLMQRDVNFWGNRTHARSVPLRGAVRKGLLIISGFARDLAGNRTELPQCVVDPVTGQGRCIAP
ncbi:MAG: hypothetical protein QOD65_2926 [Gaiellales bacterium]|nr:hypothetical protein [Gaiellales bacterium]